VNFIENDKIMHPEILKSIEFLKLFELNIPIALRDDI